MKTEIKVGLFVFVVIAVLGLMTFKFGNLKFGKKEGYNVSVIFDSVTGLEKKALVKVAGVEVGEVEDIRLEGTKAKVILWIKKGIKIPKGARVIIRTMGLMGEKFIEITGGDPSRGYIKPGESLGRGISYADMDYLISQMADVAKNMEFVTQALVETIGSPTGKESIMETLYNIRVLTATAVELALENKNKLVDIIDNLKQITENLKTSLEDMQKIVRKTLVNVEKFSEKLPAIAEDASYVVSEFRKARLSEVLSSTLSEVERISENLREISDRIRRGEGTVGKLFTDESLYKNINEAAYSIKEATSRIDRTRLDIEFKGDYMFKSPEGASYTEKPGNTYGYFNVRLQPREDRFYLIGVTSDPRGEYEESTEYYWINNRLQTVRTYQFTNAMKFTVQYGIRFMDNVDFRIGLRDSTAGFGIDWSVSEKAMLSLDAWDFSGDYSAGGNPRVRATFAYRLIDPLFIEIGWDDPLNPDFSTAFVGAGLKFSDDDLKYLLFGGAISSIK